MSITYQSSGVSVDTGNEVVSRIKRSVEQTHSSYVVSGLGGFGSLFDIKSALTNYKHPLLVQSVDGVGTKLSVAKMMNKFDTIGIDIVSACTGDIVAMGARPLTFLDYVASSKLDVDIIEEIVSSMAVACKENDISLVGGETAEMPGVYVNGEYDIVGSITGVVEKDKVVTGKNIITGDVILGFGSSGLHTNGFSLARKLFFEIGHYSVTTEIPEFEGTVGEELLRPHINYAKPVLGILDSGIVIKGIAHITGGGLLENIPRILPKSCVVEINKGSWPVLPIFNVMREIGGIAEPEMYRTFNMGIGMVLVVAPEDVEMVKMKVSEFVGFNIYEIGKVVERTGQVVLK